MKCIWCCYSGFFGIFCRSNLQNDQIMIAPTVCSCTLNKGQVDVVSPSHLPNFCPCPAKALKATLGLKKSSSLWSSISRLTWPPRDLCRSSKGISLQGSERKGERDDMKCKNCSSPLQLLYPTGLHAIQSCCILLDKLIRIRVITPKKALKEMWLSLAQGFIKRSKVKGQIKKK